MNKGTISKMVRENELLRENPSQLDMLLPPASVVTTAQDREEIQEAYVAGGSITDGLASFQLKPKGLKGTDLLDHMHRFLKTADPHYKNVDDGRPLEPSSFLDLEVTKYQQKQVLNLTEADIRKRQRIQDAGGTGGHMMTALRTLNMLGTVTNESGMANDEVTLEQLKNKFELKASMETMSRLNAVEAEQKKQEAITSLQKRLPEAEKKIKAANGKVDGRNIYKADLQAVLIIRYHKDVQQVLKSTIKKPELVTFLYENCSNVSVVLPPGAAGEPKLRFKN